MVGEAGRGVGGGKVGGGEAEGGEEGEGVESVFKKWEEGGDRKETLGGGGG